MPVFIDMTGRTIEIPANPQRIISLVPSQTELLYDLGLDTRVVGITTFCVHPETWYKSKPRVGGTKKVHIEKVRELRPDLIIANKEENVREQVEAMEAIAPVWVSDIATYEEALSMIAHVGRITSTEARAQELIQSISNQFALLACDEVIPTPTALYLIWRDPWMSVGGDTFIHDMLTRAGLINVTTNTSRYPALSREQIQSMHPDVVLLSSEPYPFHEKHFAELQEILPSANITLVDGRMFSWYGSRLLYAPEYFQKHIAPIYRP